MHLPTGQGVVRSTSSFSFSFLTLHCLSEVRSPKPSHHSNQLSKLISSCCSTDVFVCVCLEGGGEKGGGGGGGGGSLHCMNEIVTLLNLNFIYNFCLKWLIVMLSLFVNAL